MATLDWRLRRTLQAVFTVWFVITLTFIMVRILPGNPMMRMLMELEQQGFEPASAARLVEIRLGFQPDDPLHIAYWNYMVALLQGDLGRSIYYDRPVSGVLADALPWTLFLMTHAIFISFFMGIILGAIMAYWEGGKLDVGLTTWAIFIGSVPFYVLAIILLMYLSHRYAIFPAAGRSPTGVPWGFNLEFIIGIYYHGALPILSMLVASGAASLGMRGNSIRVLGEDYLRVARLRGLTDFKISVDYIARNAVLPLYTGLLISIGSMFGGAIILEIIFVYRGVGYYMMQGVWNRDYPLMMGAFVLITIAVVIALFIADLTYSMIDPRAGGEGRETF